MTRLTHLLHEAVPEPPFSLDPDAVLDAARRRQRIRRTWATGCVAVVAAAGVAAGVSLPRLGLSDRSVTPAGSPVLSVVDHRAPLPAAARAAVAAQGAAMTDEPWTMPRYPGEGSLLASSAGGTSHYLIETTDDFLCVITVVAQGSGVSCQPRSDLVTSGIVVPWNEVGSRASGGQPTVVGVIVLVPDGYEEATTPGSTVRVRDNAAFVRDAAGEPSEITLTGPGVPPLTFRSPYCASTAADPDCGAS